MKQLGLSFAQYVQDNDEEYPSASNCCGGWADGWSNPLGTNAQGVPITWDVEMQPYLKSVQVLKCPDDSLPALPQLPGLGANVERSYAVATHIVDFNYSNTGVTLAQIPSPSITILLCERGRNPAWPSYCANNVAGWGCDADIQYLDDVGFTSPLVVGAWAHGSTLGSNFLYADGHVKLIVHSASNVYSTQSFPGYYHGPNNSPEFGYGRPMPE